MALFSVSWRLGGWETEKPEAWNDVILTAIPKKTDKVGLQSMRYIVCYLFCKSSTSALANCCKS